MVFSTLKRLGKVSLMAGLLLVSRAALAGTLTDVSIVPADDASGASSNYTFTYTLAQDVGADEALFYVTFPADFTVDSFGTACDKLVSLTLTPSPGLAICREPYGTGNTVGFAVNSMLGGGVDVPAGTVVEVVISGITNPVAGGDYDFDAGSSTQLMTTEPIDTMIPGPAIPKDVAPLQTVTIGIPGSSSSASSVSSSSSSIISSSSSSTASSSGALINGTCGIAHTGTFAVDPPTETLCDTGNPASYSANLTDYTWDCEGENGGSPASCSASLGFLITPAVTAGGTFACAPTLVPYGNSTTCTAAPNAGYSFDGWGAGNCNGVVTLACVLNNVVASPVLDAQFSASPTFTITVNTSGSGTASCTPNPVTSGSNATCTASANTGNNFTGWTGDCTGGSCSFTNVTTNKTVTANFVVRTYSLSGTATPAAGGNVSCSGSVSHGSSGSCTATANTGYTFTSWNGCPSASANTCSFSNVTSNQNVTANFTAITYTVTGTASPADAGSATCTSPVNHGASASCTANPAAGYRLKDWSGACTGSSCAITSVTANSTVTANFEKIPTYNVSTSVSPADSGRVSCTKDILEGSSATCSAIANNGFQFKGWSGDCAGAELRCVIANVTANKSLTATFEEASSFAISASVEYPDRQTYRLDVNPSLPVSTYVSCTASNPVARGTNVTCRATLPVINFPIGPGFMGWAGDCTRVEGESCIIENMSSDKHLTLYIGNRVSSGARINPEGAGSVWCTSTYIDSYGDKVNYAKSNCKAVANTGYLFASYGSEGGESSASIGGGTLVVNFTPVPESPKVSCSDCNTSNTQTYTSTTNTTSKTTEPDANGTSTQSTVATTTNLQNGQTGTQIIVAQQNTSGVVTKPTTTYITDPNLQTQVNPDGTVGFTSNNLTAGTSTSGSLWGTGLSITTGVGGGLGGGGLGGGLGSTVNAGSGSSVTLGQTAQGTNLQVTTSGGQTTSVTTTPENTTITIGQNQQQVSGTNTTITVTDAGTTTTVPVGADGQSITSTVADGNSQTGSFGPQGITTTASLNPGGTVNVIAYIGEAGTVTFTLTSRSITGDNISKPGRHSKTAKAEEERVINIDMGTGELVSIGLGSANEPFFTAQPNDPLAPIATGYETDEESFDLTLTFPAAN